MKMLFHPLPSSFYLKPAPPLSDPNEGILQSLQWFRSRTRIETSQMFKMWRLWDGMF
jgi:hypothetical protein